MISEWQNLYDPVVNSFFNPGNHERRESIPLSLFLVVQWERRILMKECSVQEQVLLGGFLCLLWGGLRFADGQRVSLQSLSWCITALRGSCYRTKTLQDQDNLGRSRHVDFFHIFHLVVFATVRLSYLWYGVSWLIGSCLHSASWQQRLRPCVGLCPLHHVVGVVHVPLAPSLRYSPSCDPEYPSDTAKAARARLLGLCCFLPPVLLPSRASALSFLDGLRLSPSPRALVLLGFVCPPCGPLSWLVLVAPPSVWSWFVLLAWPVFCFVGFVWFRCVRPWLVSLFCVLLLVASPHAILVRYARVICFHLHYSGLYHNWTCVFVRRLDRFTCASDFHRFTMSLLLCYCVTIRRVLR